MAIGNISIDTTHRAVPRRQLSFLFVSGIHKLVERWDKCLNRLGGYVEQEAQLSPSDRAMRLVSSNLASYHATVQKLLIRQVLTKLMV